ncbi:MAG: ABC transporter ATP-binding protein [Spirochaetota bacterium]
MIHFKHVTVRRQGKPILDDLTLDLEPGEHCAIIGPNGSGKSTLVEVISKDVHPIQHEQLEMTLYGKKRWNVFSLRKRLGIVSDRIAQLCNTTYKAREIVLSGFFSSIGITFSHQITDHMEAKAEELLTFMGISHIASKPMNQLSSGEARRVLIARALVHDPETLILDEPSSNLDLKTQSLFKQSIRSIAHSGKTILLVTHDLADIIPEIQQVVILKEGRLFAQGNKEDLLKPEVLSEAYGTPVFVDHHEGWYKAWC